MQGSSVVGMEQHRRGSREDGTPEKATAGMEVTPGKAKREERKCDRGDSRDELMGRGTGVRDRRESSRRQREWADQRTAGSKQQRSGEGSDERRRARLGPTNTDQPMRHCF